MDPTDSPFEFIDEVEERVFEGLTNPPKGVPLVWWPKFTELTSGFMPHEFSVLCAPTGSGKTTLCAQLVCQALLASEGSYICSAEIGNEAFLRSMLSAFEGRDYVSKKKHDEADISKLLRQYRSVLRSAHLIFSRNDDRIEVDQLIREIEIAHRDFRCKLAILDNLQFFLPLTEGQNTLTTTDLAIREFKRFIRRTPVHVMLIAHPKKTEGDIVTDHQQVKGSSTIFQECDRFYVLNRIHPDVLDENPSFRPTDRELKLCKLRFDGMNQGKKIYFEFDGGRYREKNVEWGRC